MAKLLGSLSLSGIENNQIFNLDGPYNRDGCLEPYARLRELFLQHEIELNTADLNLGKPVAFDLHLNFQQPRHALCYLLQMETEQILPANFDASKINKYRKIFTWHDAFVDGARYIKLNFPNPLAITDPPLFDQREQFACMISANKAVFKHSPDELYSERVNTIKWFENNAPLDFSLYGIGWNLPARRSGFWGAVQFKLLNQLARPSSKKPFPSYKGRVDSKAAVLRQAKFCICYENVKNTPGYITEKIFDSFFSGCVPIYWGAPNVGDYIPTTCYIDRNKFSNHRDLYAHLKSITADRYLEYQHHIRQFLKSDQFMPFGSESFAQTIVQNVMRDLFSNEP